MKFLLIASFPSSILNFRGALLTALKSRGYEIHVAAPDLHANTREYADLTAKGFSPHNISLRRTGMNPLADLGSLLSIARLIVGLRPDVLLSYTAKPVIYGTIAATVLRVPRRYALVTGLGFAFGNAEGMRRRMVQNAVKNLYRMALLGATKVFFQNPDDEALFRSRRILAKNIASYVVNGSGVEISKFEPCVLPSGAPRFLLIARLLGEKGVREYAATAALIKKAHPEVHFSLVGWIDDNPDSISQKELDAWVATGTIEFLGRLSDVRPAIAANSIYVLPSYREGTPRTVLEAMAMGRAVITTDAPGCRETVVHGSNGFLIPVRSTEALAQAMLRFIEQPELIAEMGKQARKMAEDKYDVHEVNRVMLREMNI